MASCKVRRYEDSDYETVRNIFTAGMTELQPSVFVNFLKQPTCLLGLMSAFCILLLSSKSFLLPVLGVTLLVALLRYWTVGASNRYITDSLNSDLMDIQRSYMKSENSCFWVAELDGCCVGMVACHPDRETVEYLELGRMSVLAAYRRKGIAKVLCRTVIDFARQSGYNTVVLKTSEVQVAAHRLYESVGFKKVKETSFPLPSSFVDSLLKFKIYRYRYDIPTVVDDRYK
ncbi:probable N-acetyltransferase camello [Protopterus annectens]|uniref:probable N-acetyltransferase camello n=1 Tax=Protopterus annectens TaxID=7888 RepID=UPI001CFC33AE|nr:probable N-acetyltransferase camello [Protopterus annectens]